MSTTTFPTAAAHAAHTDQNKVTHTAEPISIPRLIALHLLPGLLIALGYTFFAWYMRSLDVPSLLPFTIVVPLILIPVELGYLLYQGKRTHGHFTLRGVIQYNQSIGFKQYAIWTPLTLLASIALFVIFGAVDTILFDKLFFWWPTWMNPDYIGLDGSPPMVLWGTVGMLMLFGNWMGPAVEELYFRGHLLPRMAHLGRWGVVLNGTLFALYHFWSPWHIVSRAIGILPLGFIARRQRNVIIPLVVHCTLNTVGTLLALAAIL